MFDTLILTAGALTLVSLYVTLHIRPLLNSRCDYLLINSNGNMCENLCNSMTIIIFEAIGKYIHPTRYRQIIETTSSNKLSIEEQSIISKDQKHHSRVAEVNYKRCHPYPLCHAYRQMDDKLFTHSPSLLIGLFQRRDKKFIF